MRHFKAIELAEKNDIILLAGKGHETYQILGRKKIHFDDREIARREIIRKKRKNKGGKMLINEVKKVKVGKDIEIGGNNRFTLIAGTLCYRI